MIIRHISGIVLLLSVLSFPGLVFASSAYTVLDLGTLGDGTGQSSAYGVMYDAQTGAVNVVGSYSTSANQPQQAFLYSYNIASQSGQLTNISPASASSSLAFAVSSNGMITGTIGGSDALNPFNSSTYQPFVGSTANTPASVIPASAQGFGINSSGQVVGQIDFGNTQHAFVATNSGGTWNVTDIGRNGANSANSSYAQAINNSGQIVGQDTWGGTQHATVWTGNTAVDLSSGLATSSIAKGINENGQIVGYYSTGNGVEQAALWQQDVNGNWVQSDVGSLSGAVLSSHAFSINSEGLIVGEYYVNGTDTKAFVYDSDTSTFEDLWSLIVGANPFSVLQSAAFITELDIPGIHNAIVGVGLVNGFEHAFLAFDPTDTPIPNPEPGTMALLGCGLAGLAMLRRRRRTA